MYSRFLAMDSYTRKELEKLQDATVAVVGLGATGSVIAEHLARHGVNLVLVDRDYLEEKDVYTSGIYSQVQAENSVPKAVAAGERLEQFTNVETHVEHIDGSNIELLSGADVIMDGTDNLETRFLLDEYSRKTGTPWIYTAAVGEKSCSMFFQDKCFSCIFDEVPAGSLETCETAGIMREAASIAASRSAWKAVRFLAGREPGEQFEIFPGETLDVESSGCEVCEENVYPHLESSSRSRPVCGENKYQVERDVSRTAFNRLKEAGNAVTENSYLTRAVVNGKDFTLFRSGRAIIEARDRNQAEARFDRLLGG